MKSLLSNRNIASLYIFIFITHIFLIDGMSSTDIYAKVVLMAIAPIIFITRVPYISKAFILGMFLFLYQLFSALLISQTFRSSSIIFSVSLIFTFILVYNLIYSGAFSREYFIQFLKFIILSFTICLVVQQITNIIGISQFIFINKVYQLISRGVFAGNSLALEPSHTARILAIAFYAFLKVNEYINGSVLSLKKLFGEHRLVTLCFLWCMITMGSGTAFVALGVLSLYFIRTQYITIVVPAILILSFVIPVIDYEPLNRAVATIEVVTTLDSDKIVATDGSASFRINPIINTINNLDLSNPKHWFGSGMDTVRNMDLYSKDRLMGLISDYGLISFLLGIILIFSCCVTRFFSIETLLIFILLGFVASNIAYVWGCYMLLVPIKYFSKNHNSQQYE